MNYRKQFIEWINKQNLTIQEQIDIKWKTDECNLKYKIYDNSDISKIQAIDDNRLDYYCSFLMSMQDETLNEESENQDSVLSNVHVNAEELEYPDIEDLLQEIEMDKTAKNKVAVEVRRHESDLLDGIYQKCNEYANLSANIVNDSEKYIPSKMVIDIVSGKWIDPSSGHVESLPSYVGYQYGSETKWFPRSDKAFYYSDKECNLESVLSAYREDNPSLDVIRRSISELGRQYESVIDISRVLCLVPDSLGDFKDNIKNQIKSVGPNMVQIPRSIVAAYTFANEHKETRDISLYCFDFEGYKLIKTEVRIQYIPESDSYEYTRMARKLINDDNSWNYVKIAQEYIKRYEKKVGIKIPKSIKDRLINSKDIETIITNEMSISYIDCGQTCLIKYDDNIVSEIVSELYESISSDTDSVDYVILLAEVKTDNDCIYNLSALGIGCALIDERKSNSQIIWREYLPELSLEVIRDGTFDSLKLIDKNMFQDISVSSMEEDILIPINNGMFILPNGKDKVFCPLTREEFGSMQRDKMAMFSDKNLSNSSSPMIAELSLKYHYGDPDSYKLIAKISNDDLVIVSQWCDDTDQYMSNNKVPEYNSPVIRVNATRETIFEAMEKAVKGLYYWKNYSMTGGWNYTPPFDKNGNWNAIRDLKYLRLSLPRFFGPDRSDLLSEDEIEQTKKLLQELLYVYDDCITGKLDSCDKEHPCDLDAKSMWRIRVNILDIISLMSGLYVNELLPYDLESNLVYAIIDSKNLQYIIPLATYFTRDDDPYKVWDEVDYYLENDNDERIINAVRTISTVCWRESNWIYEFGKCSAQILNRVIDAIFKAVYSEITQIAIDYNPRRVRDYLEALLGITRLKEVNSFVAKKLDCNSMAIKEFVACLKELDKKLYSADQDGKLLYPFISRLEMENVPDMLNKVSTVIYPLIEILTDGNAIRLTGFSEEDTRINQRNSRYETYQSDISEEESDANEINEKEDESKADDVRFDVDKEQEVVRQAGRLVRCLDREGMSNEKMKSAANFRVAYDKFLVLMNEEHPSIANKMESYGDDYMSSLMYLRKFYKG